MVKIGSTFVCRYDSRSDSFAVIRVIRLYSQMKEEEWKRNGGVNVKCNDEGTSGGWGSFRS